MKFRSPIVFEKKVPESEARRMAEPMVQPMLAEAMRGLLEVPQMTPTNVGFAGIPHKPVQDAFGLDNPWWWVVPQSPNKRPQSIVDVRTMRILADAYDPMRSCIEHLKREIKATPIAINGRDPRANVDTAIAEATEWFESITNPNSLGGARIRRKHFEDMIFEDVLVIGACAIVNQKTAGGALYANAAIDASTIRPRMTGYGWPDDEIPYEQWIQGVQAAQFLPGELTYDGIHARSFTPYFASPIEWLLQSVMSAMKADEWNLSWLTDGDTVSDMYAMPQEWTPQQVKDWYVFYQSLHSGNAQERVKTKWVPSGTNLVNKGTRKDNDFQEFMIFLIRRVCSMYGVQPASIGFAGEQYKVSQESSMDQTSAFGVGELLAFRKDLYDSMLLELGYPELEVVNVTSKEEDATSRTTRLTTAAGGPYLTVNEARQEDGKDKIEGGDAIRNLGDEEPDGDEPKKPEERIERKKKDKRRDALLALLGLSILRAKGEVQGLVKGFADGAVDASGFVSGLRDSIYRGFIQSASVGNLLSPEPSSSSSAVADKVLAEQELYLAGLQSDIEEGKYDGKSKALADRANQYVARIRGVAHEAFVATLDADTQIAWILGPCAHCRDCPIRAEFSPYTKATLPGIPGDGSTECLNFCCCGLEALGYESVLPDDDLEGLGATLRSALSKWERKAKDKGSKVKFYDDIIEPGLAQELTVRLSQSDNDPRLIAEAFRSI